MPSLNNFSFENLSFDFLLPLLSKWGLVSFTLLLLVFAGLMAKQITLLNRFLPTRGGNILKWLGFGYAAVLLGMMVGGVMFV